MFLSTMQMLMAPHNLVFTVALLIVLALALLEVLSLMVGGTLLGGETEVPDAIAVGDGEISFDGGAEGVLGDVLAWLHVGRVPITILLILFLLGFGISGLALQTAVKTMFGGAMPVPIAVAAALFVAFPATRIRGGILRPLIPRDETEAVSHDSFLGLEAQILSGTARRGAPAEARLRDRYGRSHYIMVEPDADEEVFAAGTQVLVLKRRDAIYRAINNSHAVLED